MGPPYLLVFIDMVEEIKSGHGGSDWAKNTLVEWGKIHHQTFGQRQCSIRQVRMSYKHISIHVMRRFEG